MPPKTPGNLSRLAIVSTHPIQYKVPIYRFLSEALAVTLKVFYASDHSISGALDPDFGIQVQWDLDLTSGYDHEFLTESYPAKLPVRYYRPTLSTSLKKFQPTAILFSGYSTAFDMQAFFFALRHKIPVLLRPEGNDQCRARSLPKEVGRTAFLKWFYKHVDAFLAIGSRSIEHYLAHGGKPKRIFHSPYCVENDRFQSNFSLEENKAATRAALGLDSCDFLLVFCGKLIEKKNPKLILRALELCKMREKIGLLVIGSGPLKADMERLTATSNLKNILYLDFKNQSELPHYYSIADALVLPSGHGETWGLVVNEAMNAQLPCIVSDLVGCAPDLIEEGVTGFIFPHNDPAALARTIDEMCRNPENTREMGKAAARKVAAFGVSQAAEGIKKALDYVVTQTHFEGTKDL